MDDKEAIQMMRKCRDEISGLRKHVDAIEPKAEAYDLIKTITGAMAGRVSSGFGEDIVWRLDRRISELEAATVQAAQKDNTDGKS